MSPERMAAIHGAAFAGREAWDAGTIAALLARPGTRVVTEGDAGFALVQAIPPEAELLTIAVDPMLQGKGRGRALMDRVLADAAADCTVLHLEVAADNGPARALYVAAGFVETGRRRDYYARTGGARSDAVTMAIALAARQTGSAAGP